MSSVTVSMADFLAMEDRCEKLASKISQKTECFAEKAEKVHRVARVVVESLVDLESLMDLWKQKKDQWYKRNRKWEPTVVISRYPKDGSDAGQLQHLAAREGIQGAEIKDLSEASRKHGRRVESRGDVKAAFKILAKLRKRRERLAGVRTSVNKFVQKLEAGASVRIGTKKQAMAVGRLRELLTTSSLCAVVLDDAELGVSGMVADAAHEAGFKHVSLGFIPCSSVSPALLPA